MPGRLRSASYPLRTLIASAPYFSAPLALRAGFTLILETSFSGENPRGEVYLKQAEKAREILSL
jgi:hypothetical protein